MDDFDIGVGGLDIYVTSLAILMLRLVWTKSTLVRESCCGVKVCRRVDDGHTVLISDHGVYEAEIWG